MFIKCANYISKEGQELNEIKSIEFISGDGTHLRFA